MFNFIKNIIKKPKSGLNQEFLNDYDVVEEPTINYYNIKLPSKIHYNLINNHHTMAISEDLAAKLIKKDSIENTVLIRILNPGHTFQKLSGNYFDVLECFFYDLESGGSLEQIYQSKSFKEIAKESVKIKNFIQKHIDKTIIVHCHAGISRSSAVCCYILEKKKDKSGLNLIYSNDQVYSPNPFVLECLKK